MSYFSKLIHRIKSMPFRLESVYNNSNFTSVANDSKDPKVLMGKILSKLNAQQESIASLSEVEFQVFSQFGDDGIIQFLVNKIDIPHKTFIEFGVEDYKESSTRFLLINNNWSGMVIDGSQENINQIKASVVSWGYELIALASFIDAENINDLLSTFISAGFNKEVGILSIDIDGNDYWVWKNINIINPVIVIIEYNSLFGHEQPVTIPYNPSFVRTRDNKISYFGTSLRAICQLSNEKGYAFIGCNQAGNNAYFIRRDKLNGSIKERSCEAGFVRSKFRELVVPATGERPIGNEREKFLDGMPVFNVDTNTIENFKVN